VWLSPVQAVVCNITDAQADHVPLVAAQLRAAGLRYETDTRGEKITRKIAEAASKKIPYILVIGDREKEAGTVAVRARGASQGTVMPMAEAIALIQKAIAEKA
jgi:threonyl-tRNA synthetase